MVTASRERVRLHQLPQDARHDFWRGLEDSDYTNHLGCGFVPTGRECPACHKPLGPPLPEPYSYQEDFLNDDHLTVQLAGGEQFGKSLAGARKLESIVLGFIGEYKERAAGEVAWIVANSYELTAREFGYIKDALAHTPFQVKASDRVDPGEIVISLPGDKPSARKVFTIKTRSANDAQTLRAESPIAVLVCEAATMAQGAYTRLMTRVGRSRALFPGYGAIILTSTFEGSVGWYPTLWGEGQQEHVRRDPVRNFASYSGPSPANIFVYPGGFDDPEILRQKAEVSADEFNERVLAVPSPPKNRVHAIFNPLTHILADAPQHDPAHPVYVGIDPGGSGAPSHYAVEVYQDRFLPCKRKHWQGIWEYHDCGVSPDMVVAECTRQDWWTNKLKKLVIDQAGRSVGPAGGPRITADGQVWMTTAGILPMSQLVDVLPGIRNFDSLLNRCPDPSCGEPVLVFSPVQKGLIGELGGGPHPHDGATHVYSWMTAHDGTVTGRVPRDAWNDGVKASTYLFVSMQGYTMSPGSNKVRIRRRGETYEKQKVYA